MRVPDRVNLSRPTKSRIGNRGKRTNVQGSEASKIFVEIVIVLDDKIYDLGSIVEECMIFKGERKDVCIAVLHDIQDGVPSSSLKL
jgi:hypothetical protein